VFTRGQELRVGGAEAKLREMGRLQFQVTPPDAQVSYKRADHKDFQHARGRDLVWLGEGKYTITVEAPGFVAQTKNDVSVAGGQQGTFELKLDAETTARKTAEPAAAGGKSMFEDPTQVKKEGDWWKGIGNADYVFLRQGAVRTFDLTFADPGKNFVGKQRKVEWVIDYESDRQKVVYQFDGTKLERKATSGGKHSNITLNCKPTETAFQFLVTVEPGSVTVKTPSCDAPDTFASPDHDLTKGKIGIKKDLEFVVR